MPPVGPVLRRVPQLTALALLPTAYAAELVGALLPDVRLLVGATAAVVVAELHLLRRRRTLASVLSRMRADTTVRQLLRDLLLITGLLALGTHDTTAVRLPLLCGLLGFYSLHFVCQAMSILVRRDRTLPVVTRNIDTSALRLRPAPPAVLLRRADHRLSLFGLPATTGLALTAVTDHPALGAAGIALSAGLALTGALVLAGHLLPGRRAPREEEVLQWLDDWVERYRPTVGMYFSGGTSSAYQANMWLSTLARLDGRPLLVLRERFMVQKIEATDVPIVCIPKVAHLMRLERSSLKVLIHPANSGKTSQVLRIPSIKHAFTNHGESDKLSSCNPYAKAYDEVWVAGPAARERYAVADIGVEDKDVVEVGRPQLAPIRAGGPDPGAEFTTVLYAPTWEGWTDDPGNTSVVLAGENIVRELLNDPRVRLLYKPHPMTGTVDPRARAANLRIMAMIEAADAARAADPRHHGAVASAAAAERLALCTTELDRLARSSPRGSADEVERMSLQGRPEPGWRERMEAAAQEWEAAHWDSVPLWCHQVVKGPRPSLYSCFNQAHLLISDVSSVVSDYLSSEKPYAVTNTTSMGEEEFRAAFPTVRAATILTPDASGVRELLARVRSEAPDTLAEARRELKHHLLGPSEPSSLVRFNQAALALAARADERRARQEAAASAVPQQRGGPLGVRPSTVREAHSSDTLEVGPGGAPEGAGQGRAQG
ncbi:hypothetical protein [Wenjunlia tyrosinilytica]|uniref:Integral membrane protein n=1 Tax=Wenjunlia tyrosinilytica TaxID=1544741 RepID=A0A918DRR3_9ACTN|nr:hypothetical protein [Wenjunlia tyrosinilytica]GGO80861.1 hypothetical protein GCM10012280_03760 [Wenjunlia tyrosinilytica]